MDGVHGICAYWVTDSLRVVDCDEEHRLYLALFPGRAIRRLEKHNIR